LIKMGNIKYIDEEILIKKATGVHIKELGPVEAIRFINMLKRKSSKALSGIENGRNHWIKILSLKRSLVKT